MVDRNDGTDGEGERSLSDVLCAIRAQMLEEEKRLSGELSEDKTASEGTSDPQVDEAEAEPVDDRPADIIAPPADVLTEDAAPIMPRARLALPLTASDEESLVLSAPLGTDETSPIAASDSLEVEPLVLTTPLDAGPLLLDAIIADEPLVLTNPVSPEDETPLILSDPLVEAPDGADEGPFLLAEPVKSEPLAAATEVEDALSPEPPPVEPNRVEVPTPQSGPEPSPSAWEDDTAFAYPVPNLPGNAPTKADVTKPLYLVTREAETPDIGGDAALLGLDESDAPDEESYDPVDDLSLLDRAAQETLSDPQCDMVAQLIRAELEGEMGETFSNNIRQIIREEIARALQPR